MVTASGTVPKCKSASIFVLQMPEPAPNAKVHLFSAYGVRMAGFAKNNCTFAGWMGQNANLAPNSCTFAG